MKKFYQLQRKAIRLMAAGQRLANIATWEWHEGRTHEELDKGFAKAYLELKKSGADLNKFIDSLAEVK